MNLVNNLPNLKSLNAQWEMKANNIEYKSTKHKIKLILHEWARLITFP